ncbi:MAG: hypothetical protein RBU37_22500, partial [Myxococcota bacterium]|nr:hypothetical protein [Myxococcota bacterium]
MRASPLSSDDVVQVSSSELQLESDELEVGMNSAVIELAESDIEEEVDATPAELSSYSEEMPLMSSDLEPIALPPRSLPVMSAPRHIVSPSSESEEDEDWTTAYVRARPQRSPERIAAAAPVVQERTPHGEHLRRILDDLDKLLRLVPMPRISRRLAAELRDALESSSQAWHASRVAASAHELAELLRAFAPRERWSVCTELDELSITVQPSFHPAHQALIAHALGRRDSQRHLELLERWLTVLRQQPHGQAAYSELLVELALLKERAQPEQAGAHGAQLSSLYDEAIEHAGGHPLALIQALRAAWFAPDWARLEQLGVRLREELEGPLQAALLVEAATVLWQERGDLRRAMDLLRVSRMEPSFLGHAASLQVFAWQARARDIELEASRALLARLVAEGKTGAEEKSRQRELKRRGAALFQRCFELNQSVGQHERARTALDDALSLAPRSPLHHYFACELSLRQDDANSALHHLSTLRELSTESRRQAQWLHMEAIQRQRRAPLEAHAMLAEAFSLDPGNQTAFFDFVRLSAELGRYSEAVSLGQGALALEAAASERLLEHRAELLETESGSSSQAFDCYVAVLAQNPGDVFALAGAERTAFRAGRLAELAELFLELARKSQERVRKTELCWRAGQLFERALRDRQSALRAQLALLEELPSHQPALEALVRLYRLEGFHQHAIDVIEEVIGSKLAPEREQELRDWLGYLGSIGITDPQRSRDLLERIVSENPDNAVAQSLLRASLLAARNWNGLEAVCERFAQTMPPDSRRELLLQAAIVSRSMLNDNVRAQRHLLAAKTLEPLNPSTLDLLEEVYLEEAQHDELVNSYEARAPLYSGEERALWLEQAAALSMDVLQDERRATRLYTEALQHAPQKLSAWAGASALARRRRDWDRLVELLSTGAGLAHSQESRLVLLREQAFVLTRLLGRHEDAVRCFRAILDTVPDDLGALRGLRAIFEATGDALALSEVLGRLGDALADPDERLEALLAQLRTELRLQGKLPFARLERLFQLFPMHPEVLRLLIQHPVSGSDRVRLIELLSSPSSTRSGLQHSHELWELARLNEEAEQFEEALLLYEQLEQRHPELLQVKLDIIRVLDALGDAGRAAQLCEEMAKQVPRVDLRLVLLRSASSRFGLLGQFERMAKLLEQILEFDPDDEQSYAALRSHYQKVGDISRLSALLASRSDDQSIEARVGMLREIARAKQVETGSPQYRQALEELVKLVPDDLDGLRRLAEIDEEQARFVSATTRWETVLKVLAEREGQASAQRAEGPSSESSERREIVLRVARLWRERCAMPRRAAAHYSALLKRDEDDVDALEGLGRSQVDLGELQAAAQHLNQAFELV